MTHFLKPSGIRTVLLRTPFSYGIITFACLSSTANYDVQVPSFNNVYCALYSRMICWLRIQSMMICLHIFCCSFTRVSFPPELQSPVNMLFRMEIPLGKENVGSTHKAMGTPSRLFAKWQLMEVPWCFLFSSVDFFSRLFMEAGFFYFLMQRRLDDIVKRCWKESSVQLRGFCDFYWSTTTCQLETFGKFISVEILLLAITL